MNKSILKKLSALLLLFFGASGVQILTSCSSGDGGEGNSQSYSYCLKSETCLDGPFTLNDCNSLGGLPSNSCPSGGVEQSSSSSSKPSSSSSSSDVSGSSSSVGNSSSSVGGNSIIYCPVSAVSENSVTCGGQTYRTVNIGNQVWFAENLNYAVAGSKCSGEGVLQPYEVQANCDEYGRLYDWSTAMGLPSSCNSSFCASQMQQPNHRGICPEGWHLPSDAEWDVLVNFAGGPTAGTKLKATSGWQVAYGTDEYGFSALRGGGSISNSYFGTNGYWWSASESSVVGSHLIAYGRIMLDGSGGSIYEEVNRRSYDKSSLLSVRCLQDNGSVGCTAADNTETHYCSNGIIKEYGSVTDAGGQTYKTVVIVDQTWMAENLNYDASGSKCYGNKPENCGKYGRLYDWSTAMALPSSCNSSYCSSQIINTKRKGICPDGWHLPSNAEWVVLVNYADYIEGTAGTIRGTAGTKLKAISGWNDGQLRSGNGTDNYGFSALPGGDGYSDGGFRYVGNVGRWWSASEDEKYGNNYYAYYRYVSYYYEYADWDNNNKSNLFSVRCLQD